MLAWVDRVRTEAGVTVEFVLATDMLVFHHPTRLAGYAADSFADDDGTLPEGFHVFPLASVGSADEFPALLQRFDEDIWDLTGFGMARRSADILVHTGRLSGRDSCDYCDGVDGCRSF
jgi:hypothetical protein